MKNNANKRSVSFQISALGKANSFGRGEQAGVDLLWYKADEYAKLKPAEKRELNAWQRTHESRKYVAIEKKAFHISKKRFGERDDVQSNKKARANKTVAKQSVEIAALRK